MVITIIILIILATITINFAFGENGLITRAQWAQEQYQIEQVREKLEMAKGSAFADGKGSIDPDHYFDIIEAEGIIGNKENDVKDNEDGTYEVTTNEGYIFEITLVPTKENPEDIEIDYIGKGEVTGPRITNFTSTGSTTNSISVAVEGRNLEGADYTYSYKKNSEGEEAWKEFETSENSTCTITGLETGIVYDIKVEVTTSEGTAQNELSEITGELKEGSITIGEIEWQGDGTAKVTITTDITEPGCYIEYKIGADGSWTGLESGNEITLQLNDEIYVRVTDGTNTLKDAYRKIEDTGKPNVPTISLSGTAGNNGYYKSNVTVTITAGSDSESGANKVRYSVSGVQTIAETTTADGTTSATITITTDGTSTITAYTLDKAGNVSDVKTQSVNKDKTAPSKANLTVGTVTETSIAVTAKGADATSGVYSYQFQRSTTSSTSGFTTVATQTSSNASYSYTYAGLTAGTTYYLRVVVTDKAGNTKTGTAVAQATEKLELSAEDIQKNPTTYYGAEVLGYSTDHSETSGAVATWRIFYADESNIYLVADDYIASKYAPKGKNGSALNANGTHMVGLDTIEGDYLGASDIGASNPARKWLDTFLNSYGTSTNTGVRAVAYLMDTNVWSIYAGNNAEYAIGGPTLEMFCASYKDTHQSRYLECDSVTSNGYQIKWSDSTYGSSVEGLSTNEYNSIYVINDDSLAVGWWLASPTAEWDYGLFYVRSNGTIDIYFTSARILGLRPIVCLKPNVQLEQVDSDTFRIVP